MTGDIHHPVYMQYRPSDHQHAVEVCEHAIDALQNGDLGNAHTLLDEAQEAVERAQHDGTEQAHRETAYDCYE